MKSTTKTLLFVLTFAFVFSGCKKDEPTPTTTTTPVGTTASSNPQFTGTLNGNAESQTNLYVGYGSGGTVGSGSGSASNLEYSFYLLNSNFEEIIEVSKGTLTLPGGFYPTNSEFDAFFPTGSSVYDPSLANGVVINYTTSSGVTWSTAYGTADQSSSTFNIVDRVIAEEAGDHVVKVKIQATCTLYDGMGGSMTLSNAVIIGKFANI